MLSRQAIVVRGALLVLVLQVTATAARAARNTFNPSVEIGAGYTNNVTFVGPGGEPDNTDTVGLVEFVFPYQRATRKSSLSLRYRPLFLLYSEFTELDRIDHRFDAGYSTDTSRKGRLRVGASFSSTQAQGTPAEPGDPDLALTRRSDRDLGRLELEYRQRQTARWNWSIGASGRDFNYRPVPGFDEGAIPEDRTDYGGRFGVSWNLAEEKAVGGRYEYRRFDLERSGDEDSHQFSATYDWRIARRLALAAALGGWYNTGDAAGETGDRSGVLAELNVARTYEKLAIVLNLYHRPSAGGALSGTAIESGLALTFGSRQTRHWDWRVTPRLFVREPTDPDRATINSVGIRGHAERFLGRNYSLRLEADGRRQDNDDALFRVALGFRIYPWRGTELGGWGSSGR